MLRTLTTGQKTAKTNRKRYGKNYYHEIGKLSGVNKNKKAGQETVHTSFAKPKKNKNKGRRKIVVRRIFAPSRG
jgi:hypothetical protein